MDALGQVYQVWSLGVFEDGGHGFKVEGGHVLLQMMACSTCLQLTPKVTGMILRIVVLVHRLSHSNGIEILIIIHKMVKCAKSNF